jgi:hypothetical protein
MSQLVKTKRQANFKGFKRFGAFKGLVVQKNVVFNSFVCKLDLFWHSWAFKTLLLLAFLNGSRVLLGTKYFGRHFSVTSKQINVNQALTSSQH